MKGETVITIGNAFGYENTVSVGIISSLHRDVTLSDDQVYRNLIQTDWFREVATYNPISYLIEAFRSLLISGWDAQALLLGFGIATAIAFVAIAAAGSALRTRLVRT